MSAPVRCGPPPAPDQAEAGEAALTPETVIGGAPWPTTVDELRAEFSGIAASAVDPLEIASALEFDGLSDQAARLRYGYPDVFALAAELYYQVPREPAEPAPPPDPWRGGRLRPVVHSLLYGIPAICFTAAAGLLGGAGVLTILIVALVASWSLAQALAYLGYLRLGQSGAAQARGILRAGLGVTIAAVVAAVGITGMLTGAKLPIMTFGVGEGAYMLGAGVVMVLGGEAWLFAALLPGVLGSVAFLLDGRPPRLEHMVWVALAATPLLTIGLALVRTRRRGEPRHWKLRPADVPGLATAAAFGLTAAGLLTFPAAAGPHGRGGINTGALLAILPLSLSMGAAEWSLLAFRRRAHRLLKRTTESASFAFRARIALLGAVLQYLAFAVALTIAAACVAGRVGLLHPSPEDLPQVLAYLMLGSAMFLALTLQALGTRAFPVVACAVALTMEIALRDGGVPIQLVACGGLVIAMSCYAFATLGQAVRHAY